ncbi:MAG: hypothetical protein KAI95_14530, partial [Bacteroidales bacterium]|nr:hypothetical protein [Bacteroidales bacterium]
MKLKHSILLFRDHRFRSSNNIPSVFIGIMAFSILLQAESFAQDNTSFLDPPQIIKTPSNTQQYSAESRKFTGIPSLAISRNGRMWATWYAGVTPA